MHTIAETNPKDMNDLAELMPNSPWRLGRYGEEILKILAKKYTRI
jgi:hypothetical protein